MMGTAGMGRPSGRFPFAKTAFVRCAEDMRLCKQPKGALNDAWSLTGAVAIRNRQAATAAVPCRKTKIFLLETVLIWNYLGNIY